MGRRLKIVFVTVALAAVAAAGALVMRAHGDPAPPIAGQWKSWRSDFIITRDGRLYTIVAVSRAGLLNGTYRGEWRGGGALKLSGPLAPLCPQMTYEQHPEALEFCGEQFVRSGLPTVR